MTLEAAINKIRSDNQQERLSSEQRIQYETEIKNLNTMIKELEDINAHTTLERD